MSLGTRISNALQRVVAGPERDKRSRPISPDPEPVALPIRPVAAPAPVAAPGPEARVLPALCPSCGHEALGVWTLRGGEIVCSACGTPPGA